MGLINKHIHTDTEAWSLARPEDCWVFNKLCVARMAGVVCGLREIRVPKPNYYLVRPVTNLSGCGLGALKLWIDDFAYDLHPGEFWSEFLEGEHISIDYINGFPELCVRGIKSKNYDFVHWEKWEKCNTVVMPPEFITPLFNRYPVVNCEYIGGKLIEVHLRANPDFQYGNSEMIPVWEGQTPADALLEDGWTYIPDVPQPQDDPDNNVFWKLSRPFRIGMLIK